MVPTISNPLLSHVVPLVARNSVVLREKANVKATRTTLGRVPSSVLVSIEMATPGAYISLDHVTSFSRSLPFIIGYCIFLYFFFFLYY